ncbi:FHIPEP family type III secretion protein [uncultured Treponema sp.]|uniref:FHIPEP family type III secretion protein n=1 Tax=uncultured Treponema sp. TaxID=162155 RepID=UPI0025F7BC55|nr:FHIPEP family type III secretion protein [uncultured Treponema sp.]
MSKTRTITLGIFFAFVVLLLFLPLPSIVLEILVGIEFAASVGLLILGSKNSLEMPRAALSFSLFSLAVNLGLVREMLTGLKIEDAEQIPIVSFLARILCQGNFVIGIILILVLFVLGFFFFSRGLQWTIEVAMIYERDNVMYQKLCVIDRELYDGTITEEKARESKQKVQNEADFFSAMNGAAKFLAGNEKATIALTVISIVAGIAIEVCQNGKIWLEAANSVIPLAAVNVFIFVIPLLIASLAMGMCVTKEPEEVNTSDSEELEGSKFDYPWFKFVLEIGRGLIPLVDYENGGKLLELITKTRREVAESLGMEVPKVRVIDNIELAPMEYCIKIKGIEAGKSEIKPDTNVLDSSKIIARHLAEIIRTHADEIREL